jgi:hypothetical protein
MSWNVLPADTGALLCLYKGNLIKVTHSSNVYQHEIFHVILETFVLPFYLCVPSFITVQGIKNEQ